MKTQWLKGLNEDEVGVFKAAFVNALPFRKRLIEMLDEEILSLHTSMRSENTFDTAWPYKQADLVAQTKALKNVISLISENK